MGTQGVGISTARGDKTTALASQDKIKILDQNEENLFKREINIPDLKSSVPQPDNTYSVKEAEKRISSSVQSIVSYAGRQIYAHMSDVLSLPTKIPLIGNMLVRHDEVNLSFNTKKWDHFNDLDPITYIGIGRKSYDPVPTSNDYNQSDNAEDYVISLLKEHVLENNNDKPLDVLTIRSHARQNSIQTTFANEKGEYQSIDVDKLIIRLVDEKIISDGSEIEFLGCSVAGSPDARAKIGQAVRKAMVDDQTRIQVTAYDGFSYGTSTTQAITNKVTFTGSGIASPWYQSQGIGDENGFLSYEAFANLPEQRALGILPRQNPLQQDLWTDVIMDSGQS